MFPNCSKYKHCCDESWNKNLENIKEDVKKYITLQQDVASMRAWDTKYLSKNKAPEGFEEIRVNEFDR